MKSGGVEGGTLASFPPYHEYRERAGREIPVFVLEPV